MIQPFTIFYNPMRHGFSAWYRNFMLAGLYGTFTLPEGFLRRPSVVGPFIEEYPTYVQPHTAEPSRPTSYFAQWVQENRLKRFLDLTFALIGLVLFAPLMAVISILIKLSSPGPVIYKQKRIGLLGKPFTIYKFRTMVPNADKIGNSITKRHDPRITRIGALLRKTKLDELPQLWNVVRGEMSFVGPRPDVPDIVNTYSPILRSVLRVRPGITSLASLHLKDEDEFISLAHNPDRAYVKYIVPTKLQIDLDHVRLNSVWFDLRVLVQTVWALTLGRLFERDDEHPRIKQLRKMLADEHTFYINFIDDDDAY